MNRMFFSACLFVMLAACQGGEPQKSAAPVAPASTTPVTQNQSEIPVASRAVQETATAVDAAARAAESAAADAARASAAAAAGMARSLQAASDASKASAMQTKPLVSGKSPAEQAREAADALVVVPAVKPAGIVESEPVALKPSAMAEPAAPVSASGDAIAGQALAKKCAVCHNFDDKAKMGPGLKAVFNRQAGSVADFKYKFTGYIPAGSGWRWDASHLAAWLCDSGKAVRSFTGDAAAQTRMPAQRLCDAKDQADIIAYLKSL